MSNCKMEIHILLLSLFSLLLFIHVESKCVPICYLACLEKPDNCTSTGGRIEEMGCACCETCVYTVGKGKPCGYGGTRYIYYECDSKLCCNQGKCV